MKQKRTGNGRIHTLLPCGGGRLARRRGGASRPPVLLPLEGQCVDAPRGDAFTLIELILVMAILTIAVSLTAPALSSFFRGRSLGSEARQLLSLTREGQSRAISEGIPVELWIDAKNGMYGLEAEPSFQPQHDRKAVSFSLDPSMQLEVVKLATTASAMTAATDEEGEEIAGTTQTVQRSTHPELPRLRFLPDGTISDISPQAVKLIGSDGGTFWLMLGRSRMAYELKGQG